MRAAAQAAILSVPRRSGLPSRPSLRASRVVFTPDTPLSGGPRLSVAAGLLPGLAGGSAVRQVAGRRLHPGGTGLDDVRICTGSVRELDNTKNPVPQDDYRGGLCGPARLSLSRSEVSD